MLILIPLLVSAGVLSSCATRGVIQAEEYFEIGLAFFNLGRFAEAETWFNRARAADRTMVASEYNLGRIAFATGHFAEAAGYFESILERDPENVMALKAAAFSRIKNGDLEKADALYARVLALVPESADNGFNHALVLFAMERFEESEEVLKRFPLALEENASSILLLARAQKAQNKIEAIDSFAHWLTIHTGDPNPLGIFEYGQALEAGGFYARALEQYDAAIAALVREIPALSRATARFARARLLLTVDPDNPEGMPEFNNAISGGFDDTDAIRDLFNDTRVTSDNRDEIRRVWNDLMIRAAEAAGEIIEAEEDDDEEDEDT